MFTNSTRSINDGSESDYLKDYRKAIEISPEEREELLKLGQTNSISDQLEITKTLKTNYLLEYAMKNPKDYLKKRIDYLLKIKENVNKKFVETYNQVKNQVPNVEAKTIALKSAQDQMMVDMMTLESLYPARFAIDSYKNSLQQQIAKHQLNLGGGI